jgi:hypothetical protein
MTVTFFQQYDSGLDDFERNKNYVQMGFRPGFAIQARELTQMQTVMQYQLSMLAKATIGNGGVLDNNLIVTRTSGAAGAAGNFNISLDVGHIFIIPTDKEIGYVVYNDSVKTIDGVAVGGQNQPRVYVLYEEIQVNPNGDPAAPTDGYARVEVDETLNDNAGGFTNSSAPGASRYKININSIGVYYPDAGDVSPLNAIDIVRFVNNEPVVGPN